MVGDARRADRTEQDRVKRAQPVGAIRRHHQTMLAVVVGPPIEAHDIEREPAVALGADLEHFQPGLDHLRPDAIAAQRRDLVCAHPSTLTRLALLATLSRKRERGFE